MRFMLGVPDARKSVGVCVLETKLQHWSKTHPSPLNLITPVVSIQRPDTLLAAPNSTRVALSMNKTHLCGHANVFGPV